ncbi:hypothetical protein AMTRI_Chr12g272860 [Amborella trichopoda]
MAINRGVQLWIFCGLIMESLTLLMAETCPKTNPLVGFESEFSMVQHQLRGVIKILDDCSFRVQNFDMIEGSDVHWWGALGPNFENLTHGYVISDDRLNQTYKNETLVFSLKNYTWDQIKVIAVWDKSFASDFGHVLLNPRNESNIAVPPPLSPSLAPSPSPSPSSDIDPGSFNERGLIRSIHIKPTMFDNCMSLSPEFRLRWTLNSVSDTIDIGLEAAVSSQHYMAFGWAKPGSLGELMLQADVAVTGFTEAGLPFADDYYITKYSECLISKDGDVQGVCPDTIYEGDDRVLVNNTRGVYGHRIDGVSFVRYQRPLQTIDKKYDVHVYATDNMTVVWAMGLIRPPDALRPYYLPQNHGGLSRVAYGHTSLNISKAIDDCLGPLEAEDKEDQELIVADGKTPLAVVTDIAMHYPNPPNPPKVLFINKKEAPLLRVERGVPVTFLVQAGHDVPFYITSDPIGGNASSRNMTETIYAGGPQSQGVPASPTELVWEPDRNTPDQVYYQSFFGQKMGWKVQVVDGGLSDMYNNNVFLDDQQVTLFWTLSKNTISFAVRGEKKSGYLAIGFGGGMVNSFAYVGWVNSDGKARVSTYWIDGRDAMSVHLTNENLTYVRCRSESGIITFEFTRALAPKCSGRMECNNIIDPTSPLRVVWAMGARWSVDHLSERNMHSITSSRPVRILLLRGSAEAEQDLRPVLAVHGFMMFVAWGILLPGGILAARYLKHVKGDGWFQFHVKLQYSGLSIAFLGVLFAAAELRGFFVSSLHVKFGITAILLAIAQPINASFRPKKSANNEESSSKRFLWEYLHIFTGRGALLAGIAAIISGMKHLGDRYGGEHVKGLNWAIIIWFLAGAMIVIYLEYWEIRRRRDKSFGKSNWVLGNSEEDDSVDLLHSNRVVNGRGPASSERMEVQLEPLNR